MKVMKDTADGSCVRTKFGILCPARSQNSHVLFGAIYSNRQQHHTVRTELKKGDSGTHTDTQTHTHTHTDTHTHRERPVSRAKGEVVAP